MDSISPNAAGIYEIVCTQTGRRYVGSAQRFTSRFRLHVKQLVENKHHSRYMQRAWNKYGAGSFEFRRLFVCAPENLLFYEQRAIDALNPEFNVCRIAGSTLGIKHTAAQNKTNSERCLKQRGTPEWKAAQSNRIKQAFVEGKLDNTKALREYEAACTPEQLRAKYTPEVRATIAEKAKARAAKHEVFGLTLSRAEAATKYGVPLHLLKQRMRRGWTLEKAVSTPTDSGKRAGGNKKYALHGSPVSLADIARSAKRNPSTALRWLQAGRTPEDIVHG